MRLLTREGTEELDVSEHVGSLRLPARTLYGDARAPMGNFGLLAERMRGAELVFTRDTGYRFSSERPEAAAAAILSFAVRRSSA